MNDDIDLTFADLSTPDGPLIAPLIRLVGYTRQHIVAGRCSPLLWTLLPPAWTAATPSDGSLWTQSGTLAISVGGGQPGTGSRQPGASVNALAFVGEPMELQACGNAMELQKAFYGGISTG